MTLISTTQAAYLLGVDRRTVGTWVDKGWLSATRDSKGWRWLDEAEVLAKRRENPRLADLPVPEVVVPQPVGRPVRRGIDLIDTEEL